MSAVYIDTEFIEGFGKPLWGKKRHFIDLISIGLVDDKGREYYAISHEFDPRDADDWVRENVLKPMVKDWILSHHGDNRNRVLDMTEGKGVIANILTLQSNIGKSNKQIAKEIKDFVYQPFLEANPVLFSDNYYPKDIAFYGYYADYDHVLLCSLFGRMIDLPAGFPQYTNDLKQTLDEASHLFRRTFAEGDATDCNSQEERLKRLKQHPSFPKQTNEHHALSAARWNKQLHEFLRALSRETFGEVVTP